MDAKLLESNHWHSYIIVLVIQRGVLLVRIYLTTVRASPSTITGFFRERANCIPESIALASACSGELG